MDDAGISTLEQALADVGSRLIEAEKYLPAAATATEVGRAASALGADARRELRHDTLDDAKTAALRTDAVALLHRLDAAIASARSSAAYQAALTAYAHDDQDALRTLVPQTFTAVALAEHTPSLFATVPWTRRGHAQSATEVATAIAALADGGLAAQGDELSAGADDQLRAIMFDPEPPEDEAVVLQIDPAHLNGPLFEHQQSGTFLFYRSQARVPFIVHVAESIDLDVAPPDYPAYRAALVEALRAAGLTLAPEEEPSR